MPYKILAAGSGTLRDSWLAGGKRSEAYSARKLHYPEIPANPSNQQEDVPCA